MKKFLILFFALLIANLTGCGGSGSSSSFKTIISETTVTIKLGETKKTSHPENLLSTSGIPSEVANIRFTISAPDMTTIQRVVANTGQEAISESFNVPNGTSRHFLVEALDTSDEVLYKGETDADLDGTPVTLTINMVKIAAWGATQIETNTGNAYYPDIAMDGSGNAIAVWYQYDGTKYNVWANYYIIGTGWGTAELVVTDTGTSSPQVAMDSNGNAIVVWHQNDGINYSIYAKRYVTGDGWGSTALIETNSTGDAWNPKIAMDSAGNAIAVWYQFDGTRTNIWTNRYAVGTGWGDTAELIETNDAGDAFFPKIAMDSAGNAIAVWYQSDGTRTNIWANRYAVGTGWGDTAELIETDNAGDAVAPQVAMDTNGNAIAVWYQWDGTKHNIWTNRYVVGTGWGTAELIETDTGDARNPQVAMDSSGNTIAVWSQSDSTRYNIWANRYVVGTGWGTAELIETDNAGDAGAQQVAINNSGNAITVWSQYDGTRTNIWANRYAIGTGWGTAELIETDNAGDAVAPEVVMDSSSKAVAVWEEAWDIWANHFE